MGTHPRKNIRELRAVKSECPAYELCIAHHRQERCVDKGACFGLSRGALCTRDTHCIAGRQALYDCYVIVPNI